MDTQIIGLSSYGLRHLSDFDKYTALSMAESLADDARHKHHSKAAFLSAAVQTLRTHLAKSTQLFQAYFLALFADKDYTKVLDSIAKVDKSLRSESTRPQRNSPTTRYRAVVCYECGRPGHTAPRCYLRRNPPPGSLRGNRPFPYQRPSRGRPSNLPSVVRICIFTYFVISLLFIVCITCYVVLRIPLPPLFPFLL